MTKNSNSQPAWQSSPGQTTVLLARHCETTMNIQPELVGGRSNDASLTPRGIQQAEQLGQWLVANDINPDTVTTSTALRTRQTARIALAAMGIDTMPMQSTPDILELSQGEAEGKQRIDVYTPDVLQAIRRQGKDFKLPGGESMNEVGARMFAWLNSLPQEEATHLVVTHGGSIKFLLSKMRRWNHRKAYTQPIDNGSITVVTRNISTPTTWKVRAKNTPTS